MKSKADLFNLPKEIAENAELKLICKTEVSSDIVLGFITSYGKELLSKTNKLHGDGNFKV